MAARKTTGFIIVSGRTPVALMEKVNIRLEEGWTITGMTFFADKEFHQSMVKLGPVDKEAGR